MSTCPQCLGAFDDGTPVCPNDGATLVGHESAVTLPAATARRDDATDPLPGSTLAGRYLVKTRLGQGGMGAVYHATHTVIGRPVAVKVLHERYVDRPEVAARLMNEARLASSIANEHIVDIFDFGETADGRTFVVMELLEGESLAQLLRREAPLPESRALAICLQVAGALGAAHERGVVHRDVKPENVFISQRDGTDFAKVLDFGISKAMRPDADGEPQVRLTHTGMVLGTPLYMSPEQARGEEAFDHRIDIYALGVILYESLTGEVPFRGANYLGIISDVLNRAPTPPRRARPDLPISEAAERVILRAMAKDRDQRYPSMDELGADLRRVIAGETVAAPPASIATTHRARRKRQALYASIVSIAIASVIGTMVVTRRAGPLGVAPANGSPANGVNGNGPVMGVPAATAMGADSTVGFRSAPSPTAASPIARAAITPPPAPSPPPAAPLPATVVVTIDSTPRGAEILDGPRRLGIAPTRLVLPRSEHPLALTFRLEGYKDATYSLTPRLDETIPIELQPRHRDHHPSRRPPLSNTPDHPPVTELKYQ